jgi:hypothetical protein
MPTNKKLTHHFKTKNTSVGKTLDHIPSFHPFSMKKKITGQKNLLATAHPRRRRRHC